MASPITHIVLANNALQSMFIDLDSKEFLIGTIFPDIRYLGVIDRDKTHFDDVKLDDIAEMESFDAGLYYHSFVDLKIRPIFNEILMKTGLNKLQHAPRAIENTVDIILYDRFNNWDDVIVTLQKLSPKQFKYDIPEVKLRHWYKIHQRYFAQKPNPQSIREFAHGINIKEQYIEEIIATVDKMLKSQTLISYIEELYENF